MQLCLGISVLLVAYLVTCWTFAPLFLTQVRGFSAETMSWLMGTLGISAAVGSFVVSGISDRGGRKPVMIFFSFLGVILPLGALFFGGSTWLLALIFFFGWALNGTFPLFMGTIPSESVDPRYMTTAMALVMGAGEVIGGALAGHRRLGSRPGGARRADVDHARPVHHRGHACTGTQGDRTGAMPGRLSGGSSIARRRRPPMRRR